MIEVHHRDGTCSGEDISRGTLAVLSLDDGLWGLWVLDDIHCAHGTFEELVERFHLTADPEMKSQEVRIAS